MEENNFDYGNFKSYDEESENNIFCLSEAFIVHEWIRWISYEPLLLLEKIKELKQKRLEDLSICELKFLTIYNKNKFFVKLFKAYEKNNLNGQEHMMLDDYMSREKIEELMINKLSREDLTCAKNELLMLSKRPLKELEDKIRSIRNIKDYDELSTFDSYVLHEMIKIYKLKASQKKKDVDNELKVKSLFRRKKNKN